MRAGQSHAYANTWPGETRCAALRNSDKGLLSAYIGHNCRNLPRSPDISPKRLSLVESAVFQVYRPGMVIVTTPNIEFNDLLGVPRMRFRHPGHRFEWTRCQFRDWAEGVGSRSGYQASFHDIGGSHLRLGGATQMAVFNRL